MQPVEAITRVIALADGMTAPPGSLLREVLHTEEEQEQNTLAIGVVQAMLNTALPVARFRCFVKLETGSDTGSEYTICATKIEEIVAALKPLTRITMTVYISLWEQRPLGADMLSGYQGKTKMNLRSSRTPGALMSYLQSLSKYSVPHAS